MNFSTIFANQASDKEAKDLVGDVHQPMSETRSDGSSDGCTGGIQSCTHTNCYTCQHDCRSIDPSF